jgi:hypothetical protein
MKHDGARLADEFQAALGAVDQIEILLAGQP